MAKFKSWRSYRDFKRAVREQMRYIRTPEMESFLDAVRQTAKKRVNVLHPGFSLWRAQLGCDWQTEQEEGEAWSMETPWPYGKDRMMPLRDRATEGRANPKGIPLLYLATHRNTAIAEVRPWIGSYVSVGRFKTRRELRIVDCTGTITMIYGNSEPSPAEREQNVWGYINESYASPVTRADNVADYAPTQIIAELLKAHGYDGIVYRSSVSERGQNVALFDLEAAELVQGHVFEVTHVSFKSSQAAGPVNYR